MRNERMQLFGKRGSRVVSPDSDNDCKRSNGDNKQNDKYLKKQ